MIPVKSFLSFAFFIMLAATVCGQTKPSPSDTTFLLRETQNGKVHRIYIDPNPATSLYNEIIAFDFTDLDEKTYKIAINEIKKKNTTPFAHFPVSDLPMQWSSLYGHQGNYYLYWPCETGSNYRVVLADSTYSEYFSTSYAGRQGNSLALSRMISFAKSGAGSYKMVINDYDQPARTVTIHLIDPERGIAVFEDPASEPPYNYYLMVDAKKARNFPIVVNDCSQLSEIKEFNFVQPDFKKLIATKGKK